MADKKYQRVIIVNDGGFSSGPQIVFPFFRPISLYEIEDDYDQLVKEIKEVNPGNGYTDQMLLLIDAFKDSLEVGNADPLIHYFAIHQHGSMDMTHLADVFDVLDDFIVKATDEKRPMH